MDHRSFRDSTAEEAIRLEDGEAHPLRANDLHTRRYFELLTIRRRLPASQKRQEFLDLYHQHQVIIVSGETGSGKTTQIPQFILFDELGSAKPIACTQPHRPSAISAAEKVASELDVRVGEEVGYQVRFDKRISRVKTRLSYMTDGMLVQLVQGNGSFGKYSCVIVDEAHERTIPTDLLLALLKRALPIFPDLKIVIMSATPNVDIFLDYFDQGSHLPLSGREHPVEIRYLQEPASDYANLALHTAQHIHQTTGDGDILVFMPSTAEIEDACGQLRSATWGLEVLPLYSQLPKAEQERVLIRSSRRRCIISTNIAEANLTVDGVVYIVDTGLCIESRFNPRIGLKTIFTGPISKAAAEQRASRAGRNQPGVCYRIYTKEYYDGDLLPTTPASLHTRDLSRLVLQIKAMGFDDVANFDFIDKPDPEVFFRALEDLLAMGYLDDAGTITPKGQMASKLPVHPVWFNALEKAHELGCSSDMITIAAIRSTRHPIFVRGQGPYSSAGQAQRFACFTSDHITQLNAVDAFMKKEDEAEDLRHDGIYIDISGWCSDNSLSMRALEEFKRIRMKLRKSFADLFKDKPKRFALETSECDDNLRQALAWAFSHRVAFSDVGSGNDRYRVLHHGWHAGLSPESNLVGLNHRWVIFDSFVMTNCQFLETVTAIDPEWLRGCENFREESWALKRAGKTGPYKMPLAKASFEEACGLGTNRQTDWW
ncbi:ATP-binding protein PRP16 [Fusarium pseudocircinatum]|uniref:RNA helicase n=1 Tax=Fusarium pseudocircinatum TaxID=56676 RepID=A0A8H5PET3_9HYPO|nr:ATP-binding protein PRP16 [Fusarium pseudocircinatum]